jgi:hypothetical protein
MSDPKEAQIEAQVERAMAPYRDMLPPEALAEMREMLSDFLATHPVAVRLMARLRPAPTVEVSGPIGDHDGDAADASAPIRKNGTGGLP